MRLHKKVEDFTDLIRITSEYIGLDPAFVERDYRITHALYQLYKSEYKGNVVYGALPGFEDIQAVMLEIRDALVRYSL